MHRHGLLLGLIYPVFLDVFLPGLSPAGLTVNIGKAQTHHLPGGDLAQDSSEISAVDDDHLTIISPQSLQQSHFLFLTQSVSV